MCHWCQTLHVSNVQRRLSLHLSLLGHEDDHVPSIRQQRRIYILKCVGAYCVDWLLNSWGSHNAPQCCGKFNGNIFGLWIQLTEQNQCPVQLQKTCKFCIHTISFEERMSIAWNKWPLISRMGSLYAHSTVPNKHTLYNQKMNIEWALKRVK